MNSTHFSYFSFSVPLQQAAKEYQMGKRELSKKYDLLFGISSFEKLTEFSQVCFPHRA